MDRYLHTGKINGDLISVKGKDVDDFIEDVIEHEDDNPQLIALLEFHEHRQQIENAYKYLENTDYVACKIAEGSATKEEYEDVILKRQAARDLIRTSEQ